MHWDSGSVWGMSSCCFSCPQKQEVGLLLWHLGWQYILSTCPPTFENARKDWKNHGQLVISCWIRESRKLCVMSVFRPHTEWPEETTVVWCAWKFHLRIDVMLAWLSVWWYQEVGFSVRWLRHWGNCHCRELLYIFGTSVCSWVVTQTWWYIPIILTFGKWNVF